MFLFTNFFYICFLFSIVLNLVSCNSMESLDSNSEPTTYTTQTRWRANYYTATRLQIHGGEAVSMGGFRFMGNYQKSGPIVLTGINGFTDVDAADGQDLGAETTRALENWYAAFACANPSDQVSKFKLMPYLRAHSVSGSIVTLGEAGERKHLPLSVRTYAWANNILSGVECQIINNNGEWSGRVTTIINNTSNSVTLADSTGLVAGDYLLPAPPGCAHYAWLVDHYMDTAAWRNIADTGYYVGSLMTDQATLPVSGEVAVATEHSLAGYVSPLATAAIVRINLTLSSSSLGDFAQYLWHDSSLHEFWSSYEEKPINTNWGITHSGILVPFSKKQSTWYSTDGSLDNAVVSRAMRIQGWIVP